MIHAAALFLCLGLAQPAGTSAPELPSDVAAQARPSNPTGASQPVGDHKSQSADVTFGLLKSLSMSPKPTAETLEKILRTQGLSPWREREGWWQLIAPDGEVRALTVSTRDETTLFLLYFPAQKRAMGDATLSWLFRSSASYSFEDGEGVELVFPEEPRPGAPASRRQTILVSMTTGALTRTAVSITWKHAQ